MNVFARSLTDDLASLVKKIDAQVAENASQRMRGFVVLLTDDPDTAEDETVDSPNLRWNYYGGYGTTLRFCNHCHEK